MSTTPKIKRYRTRRGSSLLSPSQTAAQPNEAPTEPRKPRVFAINVAGEPLSEPGKKINNAETERPRPEKVSDAPVKIAPTSGETSSKPVGKQTTSEKPRGTTSAAVAHASVDKAVAIEAIHKEGLTGRELRAARRMAVRHNITASSDYDAIRQLREQGIDPFKRKNMLEMATSSTGSKHSETTTLPQKIATGTANVPGPVLDAEDARFREVQKMQQEIARRRRRQLIFLTARLITFILIPTLLAGIYYYTIATPLYVARSEFLIQQSEPASSGGGLGGLLGGTPLASSQDALAVQSFLLSRSAMNRLNDEHGFGAEYSAEEIDFLTRLPDNASNEQMFKFYSRYVKISFDPTEGIVKMDVATVNPETGVVFSNALINYAEEVVDNLSLRMREDQVSGALANFEEMELKMRDAQTRVIELQQRYNIISTDIEVSLLSQRMGQLEAQLTQERLALAEIQSSPRPNQARVTPIQNRIETLISELAKTRAQMTDANAEGESLVGISAELSIAEAELANWNLMMQTSLQGLESARQNATSQTRYLAVNVTPFAPDRPSFPRAFENTLLVMLIMSGIYLMLSLTLSVLREQVSS